MNRKEKSDLLLQLGKFFIPILVGIGTIAAVGFLMKASLRLKYFPLVTGYFFPPLGKETIIPSGVVAGINPLIMALSIAFVDIIIALFLVWNYDLAKKIPFVGKFMEKVEDLGKSSSDKYRWIKPLRFFGIILFVMVPFQGSGGLVGSIVGRLIGMKPYSTFFAISIGAITGCLLIAFFADAILTVFVTNFLYGALIVIIIFVIAIMFIIYRRNQGQNNKKVN